MKIYQKLVEKEESLAVIGLGYVGLPIALEFAKKIKVIGFDINSERVEMMQNHVDPSNELESSDFEGCDISFTSKIEDLKARITKWKKTIEKEFEIIEIIKPSFYPFS